MRKTLLLGIVGGSLLLIALAPVVAGDGHRTFKANLDGYHEVPSISSAPAAGSPPASRATTRCATGWSCGTSARPRCSPTSTSPDPT